MQYVVNYRLHLKVRLAFESWGADSAVEMLIIDPGTFPYVLPTMKKDWVEFLIYGLFDCVHVWSSWLSE